MVALVENLEGAAYERTTALLKNKRATDLPKEWLLDWLVLSGIAFKDLFVAYARYVNASLQQEGDKESEYAIALLLKCLGLWKNASEREQRQDLVRYAVSAVPTDVDLGSVLTVLRGCEHAFKQEGDIATQIKRMMDDLDKVK